MFIFKKGGPLIPPPRAATTFSDIRLNKDLQELAYNRTVCRNTMVRLGLPSRRADVTVMDVSISPQEGCYRGATFKFVLRIPDKYPFCAPTAICETKVYHPNICIHTGMVHLPALADDWNPVMSVNSIIMMLQLIFLEPFVDSPAPDPINQECAHLLQSSPRIFHDRVAATLRGGCFYDYTFPPNLTSTVSSHRRKRSFNCAVDTDDVSNDSYEAEVGGNKRSCFGLEDPLEVDRPALSPDTIMHGYRDSVSYFDRLRDF
eukprot:GILK01008909.1.p1 GENE.GILK01008909.1~~GILK01008909.1.p1  ORF type:complete len:260 (+),score=18.06 GILK01008909.1:145-924(+)